MKEGNYMEKILNRIGYSYAADLIQLHYKHLAHTAYEPIETDMTFLPDGNGNLVCQFYVDESTKKYKNI